VKYRNWRIFALLALLLVALALPVQASAFSYVQDEALLITATKAAQLEETAASVSEQYGCGVYIVAVQDYSLYGSSVREAAENYFLVNGLGLGNDSNGVLLFLSMAERDYALIAHGNIGNTAFTDYGKDVLSEAFLDDFRYDDWAGGFADYLDMSGQLLHAAAAGEPVDVTQGGGTGLTLVLVLLVPALIAGISCAVMVFSMKTARIKTHADEYRKAVRLSERQDRFITRTVVRQKIESSSSSSRGGTSVNSRGFSGKSGKF